MAKYNCLNKQFFTNIFHTDYFPVSDKEKFVQLILVIDSITPLTPNAQNNDNSHITTTSTSSSIRIGVSGNSSTEA